MYNINEQLSLLKVLGVLGIRVFQTPNERPKPGEKLAGGEELTVKNDQGFLGSFESKKKKTFALAVQVERRDNLHVVWTEGRDKLIMRLGDQTPNSTTVTFVKRIPTTATLSGEFTTKNNDQQGNSVWIISTADGQLRMWEVAIVTIIEDGKSKYYLSLQKVYEATMYEDFEGSIFVSEEEFPGYVYWLTLQSFLDDTVTVSTLKPVSEYYEPGPEKKPVALADGRAEVIWFNQAKGFGFARVDDETTSPNFHRSQVLDQEFPAFRPGQIIRYDKLNRLPNGKVQLMGVTE